MYVQAYVMDSRSECTIYAVFSWSMSSAKAYVNYVHSVQSDLELCLLQKPIYMYVEA